MEDQHGCKMTLVADDPGWNPILYSRLQLSQATNSSLSWVNKHPKPVGSWLLNREKLPYAVLSLAQLIHPQLVLVKVILFFSGRLTTAIDMSVFLMK